MIKGQTVQDPVNNCAKCRAIGCNFRVNPKLAQDSEALRENHTYGMRDWAFLTRAVRMSSRGFSDPFIGQEPDRDGADKHEPCVFQSLSRITGSA